MCLKSCAVTVLISWILVIMESLPPPAALSFTGVVAHNFKQFEQAFNIYMIATGLNKKDNKTQANILLHVIGAEAVKVYNGFTWAPAQGENAAEDKEDPKQILKKFEDYCTPCKDITYERHLFNKRSQQVGETFNQFHTHLCHLSHTCEFGNMTDQMMQG